MREGPDIVRIAALIGDPARANILTALLSGMALTAGELAEEAGVTAATASGHLAQLSDAGLIVLRKQGRHRYFRLADDSVAGALETLAGLAAGKGHLRTRTGPRDAELRRARICYDHLAGELAVHVFDSMARRGFFTTGNGQMGLTSGGAEFAAALGLDPARHGSRGRPICRACLDWSERRDHLAGRLGAALFQFMLDAGWARRRSAGRSIEITARGAAGVSEHFPR